jgi:dUTP pyrophosphatase
MTEFTTDNFMSVFKQHFDNKNEHFAVLKIAVNPNNEELLELYKNHIEKHNHNMKSDYYHNAGFDLFIPKDIMFDKEIASKFIDLEIKTEMIYYENPGYRNCCYNMHPRSSISKTPLMLANHTGIVDAGYRGSLIGAFRWLKTEKEISYNLEKHTRLLQICHPSLCRIMVSLVEENELSTTERGDGGFGSTGIVGL